MAPHTLNLVPILTKRACLKKSDFNAGADTPVPTVQEADILLVK
jgi:hypothetical protein